MDIEVQKEGRELVETCSQMADEELRSLAAEGNELTDLAKQALKSQLMARGVKVEFVDAAPVSEAFDRGHPCGDVDPSELEPIDIAHAFSAEDGRALKTALDKGRVPSFIGSNNIDNVDYYHGRFEDGIPIRACIRSATGCPRVPSILPNHFGRRADRRRRIQSPLPEMPLG